MTQEPRRGDIYRDIEGGVGGVGEGIRGGDVTGGSIRDGGIKGGIIEDGDSGGTGNSSNSGGQEGGGNQEKVTRSKGINKTEDPLEWDMLHVSSLCKWAV